MSGDATAAAVVREIPWSLVVPHADVYLVGYGNRLPNDFTLEMLAALKRCKRVFGVPPIHAPAYGIPTNESLLPLYGTGKRRTDTYMDMAETVLAAAAADPPVALATYGSAMVGTNPTHLILELAPQRGLRVHVTCAPSSFDGIWADFNIDPLLGFEIWEATALVRFGIEPDTRAHLLLPQVPILNVHEGIDPQTLDIKISSTVVELRDHLLRSYPPDHEVHHVTTGAGPGSLYAPIVETVALRDLRDSGSMRHSTLLVPRIGAPGIDFGRPAGVAAARGG